MKDIFTMQMKLNIRTLANIGLDFDAVMEEPARRDQWIENYRKALSAEVAELIREVDHNGLGSHNGKVEVVDILHFLVSLSQIIGVSPQEALSCTVGNPPPMFQTLAVQSFLYLDDLQNSVKWKSWARGGGYKPEKAREALLGLWTCFADYCGLYGMDFETVKDIYMQKNEVNFARQANGYNEDTKSEDDNRAITT